MPLDLSIVIPSHNRPDLLQACLRSLAAHAPPCTEIVVVDDGSTDRCISRMAATFMGVRTIRLSSRQGFCVAANRGVQMARGSLVELLNDDAEVTAGWAESGVACFADPGVAAVAPLVLYWPGREGAEAIVDSAGDRFYVGGVAAKRGHRRRLAEVVLERGPVFAASASSAFFRRDVFLRIGGLPESFRAYFDDIDLAFRIHRAGYRVLFEPASRVLHHVSASHGLPGRRLVEQQSRNEERVFWRNIPACQLPRAIPLHLAVLAGKSLRRWGEGTLIPFLCGRFRLLSEVAELVRHRRKVAKLGPVPAPRDCQLELCYWGRRTA
jgi:GT2 family glycosyltransferase